MSKEKNTVVFPFLLTITAGVWRAITRLTRRTARKEKKEETSGAIQIHESAWVDGCSSDSAGEIATFYDSQYPDP